jgi:hypothetical protein
VLRCRGKDALAGLDLIQVDDTPGTTSCGCDTSRGDAGPETAVQSAEDLIIDGGCDDAGFSDGEQCGGPGMPEQSKQAQDRVLGLQL